MTHIATRHQFKRNLTTGWVLLVAEIGVAFALTPFIIRHLGTSAYGVWSLMISVIGYMGLIDVGIRGSVGRYINHYLALKDERALGEVVSSAILVLSVLGLVVLLLSFGLAAEFERVFPKTPPELLGPVRFSLPLLAVGLWLTFMASILGNLLAAREAMYVTNNFNLVVLALRAAATVAAFAADAGLQGLMLATLGITLVQTLGVLWFVKRHYGSEMPPLIGFSAARMREMWRFGVASFVSRTASTMANDSAPLIGMWILGPEAVAVYSVALTLAQYSRRLLDQANAAIFPSVMKAGAIRDLPGLRTIYLRHMDMSFAVGSLMFIGMMVFAASFLELWVGPRYASGGWVAAIIGFGYLLQSIASTGPLSLAALDKVHITMRISIAEALGCIALSALLPGLLGLGLIGLALGATLPRLLFGCAIYPWLAVTSLGPELRADLWRDLRHNALACVAVAAAFSLVHQIVPADTWPGMIAAGALVTLLHMAAFGHRYQISGAGRLHDTLQARWRRMQQGGRA